MNNCIKDSKGKLYILYLAYFVVFCYIYHYYVGEYYEYMGFNIDFNLRKFIISICIISIFITITPRSVDTRSFFLNIALTVQLLPSLVLYAMADKPTGSAMVVWMALLIVYAISAVPVPRLSVFELSQKHLMLGLALATGGIIAALFTLGGARNFNLDFRLVYEFREDAARELPGIFSYLIPIFSKIIIPFGVVVSLYYKRNIFLLVFILYSITLFGISNHKAILAYPVFSIAVYFVTSRMRSYTLFLYIFFLALIIGYLDAFLYISFNSESIWGWYASIMVRRAFMIPALIDYHYIEFFSNNPFFLWSPSRITFGLIEIPYDLLYPFLIGEAYFGSSETGANTGYVGSGFAQAGVWGVVLYACGVGMVIAILRAYGRHLGLPFVTAITAGQVVTMISSTDFVTLFLTHGMLVSLILLTMVRPSSPRR